MTNKLEPCPFNNCGKAHSPKVITAVGEAWVICSCGASGKAFSGIDAKDKAIEWWNDRYKRTCKVENTGFATGRCSACGVEFTASVVNNIPPDCVEHAHFCPNCGAEVLDD